MRTKPCQCGGVMVEVIYAANKSRTGWYCPACQAFDKAVGRERKL